MLGEVFFVGEIKPLPINNHHLCVRTASGSTAPNPHIRDDNENMHGICLCDTSYFSYSPVNIFGVTSYAKQLDDGDEGTYIFTKEAKCSVFA